MGSIGSRFVAIASLAAAAGLMLGACGGGQSTATPPPRPPPTVPQATTTIPPTAASTARPQTTPTASAPQATATLALATAAPRPTPSPQPTAIPTAAPADTRNYGGVLKQGQTGGVTDAFQTGLNSPKLGVSNTFATRLLYQPLFWFDPYRESVLDGLLVETWRFNQAADQLTLQLRPGLRWADGAPLTANDVKFTLDNYLAPPQNYVVAGTSAAAVRAIARVDVPDGRTVNVALKGPDVSVTALLSDNDLAILPAHRTLEQSAKQPVGSGAYKLSDTAAGVKYVFTKNPNYWATDKGKALPYLDTVENIEISLERAYPAVLTGQLDGLNGTWGSAIRNIEAEIKQRLPDAILFPIAGGNIGWGFRNIPPYDKRQVRQAFSMLTDRLAIVELAYNQNAVLDGLGVRPASTGNQWGLPTEEVLALPGFRYVSKATGRLETDWLKLKEGLSKVYQKDPADIQAGKKVLTDAGLLGSGKFPEFSLLTQNGVTYEPSAVVLTQTLKETFGGGKFNIEILEPAAFGQRRMGGQFQAIVFALHASASDEPSLTIRSLVTGTGLWNHGFTVPELDALFDQQKRETDPVKRRQLVWEFQRKLLQDAHVIPGANGLSSTTLWRGWVKNVPVPVGGASNVYGLDRVWLEKR